MKKIIEADLVSIAHKILKAHNRATTAALLAETEKLYKQLVLLHYYEENFERLQTEVTLEEWMKNKVDNGVTTQHHEDTTQIEFTPTIEETEKTDAEIKEEISALTHLEMPEIKPTPELENSTNKEEFTPTIAETQKSDEDIVEEIKEISALEIPKIEEKPVTIDLEIDPVYAHAHDDLFDVQENKISNDDVAIDEQKNSVEKTENHTHTKNPFRDLPVHKTINDAFKSTIVVNLNDRIAFEKNLFDGNADDFNRVIALINDLESMDEAKEFIENGVKPDYNGWIGKEEYEARLMELIANKFA